MCGFVAGPFQISLHTRQDDALFVICVYQKLLFVEDQVSRHRKVKSVKFDRRHRKTETERKVAEGGRGKGGRRGAEADDRKKAGSSINRSILSGERM